MQPAAAEIERAGLPFAQCPGAAADPVARLDEKHVEAGSGKFVRGGNPGGAGADHRDVHLGF